MLLSLKLTTNSFFKKKESGWPQKNISYCVFAAGCKLRAKQTPFWKSNIDADKSYALIKAPCVNQEPDSKPPAPCLPAQVASNAASSV